MKKVDENIARAETIDKEFYTTQHWLDQCKEKVFAKSWQFIGDTKSLNIQKRQQYPFQLLDKFLDEPLMLVSDDEEQLRCLSNVCTHRGFLLADQVQSGRKIVCKYHGRNFNLDGSFHSMPEFKEAENFPRPCDDLHQLPLKQWRQFLFTSLTPEVDWEKIEKVLEDKIGFLPIEQFRAAPEYNTEYHIKANWALYCDNYLEGFHIPFVHETLGKMFDFGQYKTELYDHCNVQIGFSDTGVESFDLPEGHPEYGRKVTAYYFWLYPNIMMNFYPYGVQINIVKPMSPNRCKVSFLYYIYDEELFKSMDTLAFAEKTEREDEFVVEAVQKGLQSRFYQNGRFSPTRETGVHHFHQLLSKDLGL